MRQRGPHRWRRRKSALPPRTDAGAPPENGGENAGPKENEAETSMRRRKRLRLRRRGRRAYIRSVYFLPSLATLGNAMCGFGAMYLAAMNDFSDITRSAYLIFLAMIFDVLDGRLARFTRHTTDFGGQLDSLADVVSFGAAPAFVGLRLLRMEAPDLNSSVVHLIWAFAAMYFSCAAIRLARFNVSNKHGEQHHFSFLGLPSPGAAAAVTAFIIMGQDLDRAGLHFLYHVCLVILPLALLCCGLLMVGHVRYPHLVNRYLRGRRSIGRLILVFAIVLLLIVKPQYTVGLGAVAYAAWGPVAWLIFKIRKSMPPGMNPAPPASPS